VPFLANAVKVMIASPSDVPNERQAIREIVSEWNNIHAEDRKVVLLPVGWETHSSPTLGDRPQGIINQQVLANCDLLVAVFWTRLGSPTGKAASGSVEEIEEHLKAGRPAMLYFSNAPVRPDSVDDKQYKALTAFKRECYNRGLVESYDSVAEFRDKFARQLAQTMIRNFGTLGTPGENRAAQAQHAPLLRDLLSDDAKRLLLDAAGANGEILCVTYDGGSTVMVSGKSIEGEVTPRERARWRSALVELIDHGLVAGGGQVFTLTHPGFQLVEELRASPGGEGGPAALT
jgi:hypothetical protein